MTSGRQITYSRDAVKTLKGIDRTAARAIVAKVEQYAVNPASLANNVTAMKGIDAKRLRVGNYRVIMTETLVVLTVLKVGHRREIYDQESAMTHPQYLTAPDGSRLVVLPEAEFDRLVALSEDANDLADARRAAADVATNGGIPGEVVKLMIGEGLSAVNAWMRYRGMSQADLARATGLSQPMVSDICRGRVYGSPETRRALADALGATPHMLDDD